MNKSATSDFGARLRQAFGGATNAQIARQLQVTKTAVGNYMSGREPAADTLREIARLTKCSLHWLLTGQGTRLGGLEETDEGFVLRLGFGASAEWMLRAIKEQANAEGRSIEDMSIHLLAEALMVRIHTDRRLAAVAEEPSRHGDESKGTVLLDALLEAKKAVDEIVLEAVGGRVEGSVKREEKERRKG